jgi:hypothetical protein
MPILDRLKQYLSTRRNFLVASTVGFGIPFGLLGAFLTRNDDPIVPVLTLVLAPVVGYGWGVGMWVLLIQQMSSSSSRPEKPSSSTRPPS